MWVMMEFICVSGVFVAGWRNVIMSGSGAIREGDGGVGVSVDAFRFLKMGFSHNASEREAEDA